MVLDGGLTAQRPTTQIPQSDAPDRQECVMSHDRVED